MICLFSIIKQFSGEVILIVTVDNTTVVLCLIKLKKKKKKKGNKWKQAKQSDIEIGWLFGFCGISTFIGYLMPNPFLYR